MDTDPVSVAPAIVDRLRSARRVVALTGAGISAESGINTFRDRWTGFWSRYSVDEVASASAFRRAPERVWAWHAMLHARVRDAAPNSGHIALARLAEYYPEFTLVTQNADGLHTRAGNPYVVELHGNVTRFRCSREGKLVDVDVPPLTEEQLARGEWPEVPVCPACGTVVRPDVVWFEEPLPVAAWNEAERSTRACEVFFAIGTSAIVYPAAMLPRLALRRHALLFEVNPEPTKVSPLVDLALRGPAGVVLPQLVELIAGVKREPPDSPPTHPPCHDSNLLSQGPRLVRSQTRGSQGRWGSNN